MFRIQTNKLNRIQRVGATYAIKAISLHFGADLMAKVPILWGIMSNMANLVPQENSVARDIPVDMAAVSELITCLQLLEVVAPYVHVSLQGHLFALLPPMTSLLRHPVKAVSIRQA